MPGMLPRFAQSLKGGPITPVLTTGDRAPRHPGVALVRREPRWWIEAASKPCTSTSFLSNCRRQIVLTPIFRLGKLRYRAAKGPVPCQQPVAEYLGVSSREGRGYFSCPLLHPKCLRSPAVAASECY